MDLFKAREIILSDRFLRNPVEVINRGIDISGTSEKIILYGPKGGGKSIVLSHREYETVGTSSPAILTNFDAVSKFGGFDDWFIVHYYELEMARNLLHYIEKYYGKVYESKFLALSKRIDALTKEFDNYFRLHHYKKTELSQRLTTGTICTQLLDEFRAALLPQSVSLLINRFDSTDCNSVIAQETLAGYFSLFDRVVLTTADQSIDESTERRAELTAKGYSLIPVDYGKDLSTVKQIVELYVAHYNANKSTNKPVFPIKLLTDEMHEILLSRAKGNINKILIAVRQVIEGFSCSSTKDIITDYFNREDAYEAEVKAKKMVKPTKFYL